MDDTLSIIKEIEELGRRIKATEDEEERAHCAARVLELCAKWRGLTAARPKEGRGSTKKRLAREILDEWVADEEGT